MCVCVKEREGGREGERDVPCTYTFKHRSYIMRTFLESEDILTGPHFFIGLF